MDQYKRINDALQLHRLEQRLGEASGLGDYAHLLHDIDLALPILQTVPDLPLFSVLPTTFEPRETWPELLSAYSLDDAIIKRLLDAGFSPLDRDSVEWSGVVGDPFPTSIESRHLLIDRDYATVLLPPQGRQLRSQFLPVLTLQRYQPYYPVLESVSSAILSLGAIRGHLAYHGALRGNYFEPIELTVSSRAELNDLVARLQQNLASRPDLQLWFRGQPQEWLSEDLTDVALLGICPWRSVRDPSLVPTLFRKLRELWVGWKEYASILLEFGRFCTFLEEFLDIPAYELRLGPVPAKLLGSEFDGVAPRFTVEWSNKEEAHDYEMTFRGLQKMFFLQHYGLESSVLDITHDLDVALFFANHQIENQRYVQVGPNPARILYIMILQAGLDQFLDSRQISEKYRLLRPLRQQCGLIAGACMINRNAYARFVSIRVHLKGDVEYANLDPAYLFPSSAEDNFLQGLVEFQRKHGTTRLKPFVLSI